VDDYLAVHGSLEDRTMPFKLFPDITGIHKVSVVGHGKGASGMVYTEGLGILQN